VVAVVELEVDDVVVVEIVVVDGGTVVEIDVVDGIDVVVVVVVVVPPFMVVVGVEVVGAIDVVVEMDVVVGIDVEVVVVVVVPPFIVVVDTVEVLGVVVVVPPGWTYSSAPISHGPVLGLLLPSLSVVPICEARFTPAFMSGEAAVNERLYVSVLFAFQSRISLPEAAGSESAGDTTI
jgi:hypothetical protein